MKKVFSILIILLFASNVTFALNWVQINDNLYIDTDTIEYYVDRYGSKDIDKYSFWVQNINSGNEYWKKLENSLKKNGEKRKPAYTNYRNLIDCKQKVITTKAFITYTENGEVLDSFDHKYPEWSSIAPGSYGEYYYNNICKPTKTKKGISKFLFGS
ncbi:MAG: hypothetical protein IJ877_03670 [Candidatus Gastranaerophilales bacterium]|nr:hypothetical protein [Candidatus Gastranaerophilales bacterium]